MSRQMGLKQPLKVPTHPSMAWGMVQQSLILHNEGIQAAERHLNLKVPLQTGNKEGPGSNCLLEPTTKNMREENGISTDASPDNWPVRSKCSATAMLTMAAPRHALQLHKSGLMKIIFSLFHRITFSYWKITLWTKNLSYNSFNIQLFRLFLQTWWRFMNLSHYRNFSYLFP